MVTQGLSKSDLGSVAKYVPAGVMVVRKDSGRIVCVNDRLIELLGFNPNGLSIENYVSKMAKIRKIDNSPYISEQLPIVQALMSGQTIYNQQLIIQRPDYTELPILESAKPLTDEKDQTVGAISIFEDLSELKRAEKTLKENEESIRLLAETGFAMIYEVNINSEEIISVKGLEEVAGYTLEETPRNVDWWISQIHPEERKTVQNKMLEITQSATQGELEYRVKHKNGRYIVVQNTLKVVKDKTGKPNRVVGGIRDITQRREIEKALEKERTTLKGIIESTDTMIAYFDLNFNFVIANSSYAKASGYNIEELIGKNHFDLFPSKENREIFEAVKESGKPVKFLDKPVEFANHTQKTAVTYWDWVLSPVKDSHGITQGLVLNLIETTEREKAEEAFRESEERFRSLVESTPDWIWQVNHLGLQSTGSYWQNSFRFNAP